jgi:hypothetical protein
MKPVTNIALHCVFFAAFCTSAQVPFYNRTLFMTAAPSATNVIDFEEFNVSEGGTTGFLGPFTELGFVRFETNANYSQEVINGFNVGQPNNKVYTTVAANLNLTIADITFGRGVPAVGFDLKSTANATTTGGGSQTFFATIMSCTTNLGTFPIVSPAGGTNFQFFGLTSSNNITEILFNSVEATPNLNIVLDNFAVAPRPAIAPIPLAVVHGHSTVVVTWSNSCAFGLQSATSVTGPYTDVAGATSPYTNSTAGAQTYFRLKAK